MSSIAVSGPARKLLRVRSRPARIARVEPGAGESVHVTLELSETGQRVAIEFDHSAWEQLRDRVNRAFVFQNAGPLPGQLSFLSKER